VGRRFGRTAVFFNVIRDRAIESDSSSMDESVQERAMAVPPHPPRGGATSASARGPLRGEYPGVEPTPGISLSSAYVLLAVGQIKRLGTQLPPFSSGGFGVAGVRF